MDDSDRQRAIWFSWARAAFGVAFLLAPGLLKGWLGEDARRPAVKVLARAFGARDLVLGVGTYMALSDQDDKSESVRRWLTLCAVSDSADAAATLLGARHLPKRGVLATLAFAGGGAYTGFRLASRATPR
ncbi:MAG: hypothetical protein QOK43_219 [Acidimicrobiaceae bacterium]|jgi:hypothetical protein|nr:hypothetical protein [Acidimicrobiaceae bacterium]MDQ1446471.1 hypothetical protein [Acidimicrobiaceae bacterium]